MLAREGSFVATARAMNMTPSALTACIKQLEHALSVRLFDRTTRSVALTAAGREFCGDALRILRSVDESVERVRAIGRGMRGSVRVAAIPSVMHVLVLPAVERLVHGYPEIRVELLEMRGAALSESVRDGVADFGIAGMMQPVPGVEAQHLFTDVLGLIAPATHPLFRMRRLGWEALAGQRFVGLTGDTVTRSLLRQAANAPASLFSPQFETDSNLAMARILERGLAVCVLSAMSSHHPAFAPFRFRVVEGPVIPRSMCLQTRAQRSISPVSQALLAQIRHELKCLSLTRMARKSDVCRSPIEWTPRRAPQRHE
ncbi:MAG: LysR family transcriptional regulator [Betaproteobacteria bacterium]|nr:LysR family transcriptional regulator [Betaproteobacteria bacterium]